MGTWSSVTLPALLVVAVAGGCTSGARVDGVLTEVVETGEAGTAAVVVRLHEGDLLGSRDVLVSFDLDDLRCIGDGPADGDDLLPGAVVRAQRVDSDEVVTSDPPGVSGTDVAVRCASDGPAPGPGATLPAPSAWPVPLGHPGWCGDDGECLAGYRIGDVPYLASFGSVRPDAVTATVVATSPTWQVHLIEGVDPEVLLAETEPCPTSTEESCATTWRATAPLTAGGRRSDATTDAYCMVTDRPADFGCPQP